MRSVLHSLLPETKQRQRPAFHSSGLHRHPAGLPPPPRKGPEAAPLTQVTLLLSCDKESVLIVSADLLGETTELKQSFVNLARCVAGEEEGGGQGGGGSGTG